MALLRFITAPLLLSLIVLGGVGCFAPALEEGLPCSATDQCPGDQVCDLASRRCYGTPPAFDGGGLPTCLAPLTECGAVCVDTTNNLQHCGGCDLPCNDGEVCGNGSCAVDCPGDTTLCLDTCFDTQTDQNNCGDCGIVCADDEYCRAGECEIRCDSRLLEPVQDDWGIYWDSAEREAASVTAAASVCAEFGGRLPTATELFRVRAPSGVADNTMNNDLWSSIPWDDQSQVEVSLGDGVLSQALLANAHSYRCVCAAEFNGFRGNHCNGPPGGECFAIDGKSNVDAADRPALKKHSAIFECQLHDGHLANFPNYVEAIHQGAVGSGLQLHVADDVRHDRTATLEWSGVEGAWQANNNTVSNTNPVNSRPFRCVGAAFPGVHQGVVTDEFYGSHYRGESVDTAAASWPVAVDTCWEQGGHVARSAELAELIDQGLPGINATIQTSDEEGRDNNIFRMAALRWGTMYPFDYEYSDTKLRVRKDQDNPFRCVYYPIDTAYVGPDDAQCNGGCSQFDLPVTGATMWLDSEDRGTAGAQLSLSEAINDCRQRGGHLAGERDLTEAIRNGLPNGSSFGTNSAAALHTGEMIRGGADNVQHMLVRWVAVDTAYDDLTEGTDIYRVNVGSVTRQPYRCMWTNELR